MVKYKWELSTSKDSMTGITKEYRLRRTEDSGRDHVVAMIIYKSIWGVYRANYYRSGIAKNFSKISEAKKWVEKEEGVKRYRSSERTSAPFGL